ncbi:transcriptional regulator [Mycolicibacterium aurum]|uniref:Transcriptional regulator n=1 Tax=Mycolicibacterium aurum TaxID=1791 RepID=A0A3S5EJ02_MYCAU|nr:MarR family transcriptional regulator [Mycolicibacterium aurum]VEG52001.1 transcriptional regulator [Mycolicibacterium aurum]
MAEPDTEMTPQGRALMERLRTFAADYTDLTHHLAGWLGVHSADAAALAEVLYAEDAGRPLQPARLARRIGLSSGATSSLLNRLEGAGLLSRSREHADRRVVTLRSVPAVSAQAGHFFAPLTERVNAVLDEADPALLAAFEQLLGRLHEAMEDVIDNIDDLVPPRQ